VEPSETADQTSADGAHTPVDELYSSLLSLVYAMSGNRTHTRLRAAAEVTVDRAGLALLRVLARASSPLRMGELAEALMVQAPHVTREIGRLEQRGLVETVREPGDQRARRAAITEDGREAVARAETVGKQWLADALHGFAPREVATAAAVLDRIADAYRN